MRALLVAASLLAAATVSGSAVAAPKASELNRVVAIVNEDVITTAELHDRMKLVARQLSQKKTTMPPEATLRRQVLDRLVLERLQLEQARGKGIRVDDETVNQVMAAIAKENNLGFEQFRVVLEKDGLEFAKFRESIRNEIIIGRLRNSQVDSKVVVTPQEVNLFLEGAGAAQNSEYHLYHILVSLPEAASPDEVQKAKARSDKIVADLRGGADFRQMAVSFSNDELGLQGGDLGWRKGGQLPTVFAEMAQRMNIGDISDPIRSSSGFHIIKLAEKRSAAASTVVQTRARHILVKTSELVSDEEARNRIGRLHERLMNGTDFSELARANSEDAGSAPKGGELGWTTPGELVPAFQQAMDKLEPGAISTPFKSQFGWHIVQVQERRRQEEGNQPQRAQAQELLRQRKIEEETQDWLRRLRDEAYVEYRLEG